jgi:hypothetical protein
VFLLVQRSLCLGLHIVGLGPGVTLLLTPFLRLPPCLPLRRALTGLVVLPLRLPRPPLLPPGLLCPRLPLRPALRLVRP